MTKITKEVSITLTEEEINSSNPIEIKLIVKSEDETLTCTITFPKS